MPLTKGAVKTSAATRLAGKDGKDAWDDAAEGFRVALVDSVILETTEAAGSAWTAGLVSVGVTPVIVIASPTAGRKCFVVKAASTNTARVWVHPTSAVAIDGGFELVAGEGLVVRVGPGAGVHAISDTAGQKVCFAEVVRS